MERGQAERLLPMLEDVLAVSGRDWRDLAAIGVCTGPGNFTGVRIADAAARGLALALDIPAIGVTRLEAMAHGRPGAFLATLDARRGAYYAQSFQDGAPNGPPALVDASDLPRDARLDVDDPSPAAFASIAALRLSGPQPPPAPLYLRPPDAAPAAEAPPLILDDA
jgi:tRNA threonylcarbamoyladenosine biosynthesis protein TsaB